MKLIVFELLSRNPVHNKHTGYDTCTPNPNHEIAGGKHTFMKHEASSLKGGAHNTIKHHFGRPYEPVLGPCTDKSGKRDFHKRYLCQIRGKSILTDVPPSAARDISLEHTAHH